MDSSYRGALTKEAMAVTIESVPDMSANPPAQPASVARVAFPVLIARVAELADALDSGSSDRKVVEVRVLSRAPTDPPYAVLDAAHRFAFIAGQTCPVDSVSL